MPKAIADRQFVYDGETYTLRFSLRAMAALQDHFNLASLDAVQQKLGDVAAFKVEDMVAVLWAGLQSHHRNLTFDHVFDMFDAMGLDDVMRTVGEAFGAAAAETGGGRDGEANPPANG